MSRTLTGVQRCRSTSRISSMTSSVIRPSVNCAGQTASNAPLASPKVVYPTFKGVWCSSAYFVQLGVTHTTSGQYQGHHRLSDDDPVAHRLGETPSCSRNHARMPHCLRWGGMASLLG